MTSTEPPRRNRTRLASGPALADPKLYDSQRCTAPDLYAYYDYDAEAGPASSMVAALKA